MAKLDELRIRDLAGLFAQYRPYVLTAIAILLIVVVLPMKRNLGGEDRPARATNAPLLQQQQVAAEQPAAVVEQPPTTEVAPYQAPFEQAGSTPPQSDSYIEPSKTGPSPQPSPSPSPALGCFPGLGCQ